MTRSSVRVRRAVTAVVAVVATLLAVAPPAYADSTRQAQWYLDTLRITEAHRLSQGEGVTVAVIDTGIDARHQDLSAVLLSGEDFLDPAVGDGDGRTDTDGHGTAMAGVIAGRGHGSADGVLGVAPGAKLLPIRGVEGETAALYGAGPEEAIRWAISQRVGVINMSFATPEDAISAKEAVEAAQRSDVVLVAGVGNRPDANIVWYPAAYPGVLAVAGVDRSGKHAAVSVTGPEVMVAAPATEITSTARGAKAYGSGNGTSYATAIVSGVVALVRAKFPDLSAAEVVHRITATAQDKGAPGRDEVYGYGIVDPVAALTADVPPMPKPTVTPSDERIGPPPPDHSAPDYGDSPVPFRVFLVGSVCLLLVGLVVAAVLLLRRRTR